MTSGVFLAYDRNSAFRSKFVCYDQNLPHTSGQPEQPCGRRIAVQSVMRREMAMDANYCREKAALCLRLADGLALNNPGRFQLMDLAEDFQRRAKELEIEAAWDATQSNAAVMQSLEDVA